MFITNRELKGSCQVDPRGVFQASIIENEGPVKKYYNCTDPSLLRIIEDLYRLLIGGEDSGYICGRQVDKTRTSLQNKAKVAIDLNTISIELIEGKRPASPLMVVKLPFQLGPSVQAEPEGSDGDEECV